MESAIEQIAAFACGTCEHRFGDTLPPLDEQLPSCPKCGFFSRVIAVMHVTASSLKHLRETGEAAAAVSS